MSEKCHLVRVLSQFRQKKVLAPFRSYNYSSPTNLSVRLTVHRVVKRQLSTALKYPSDTKAEHRLAQLPPHPLPLPRRSKLRETGPLMIAREGGGCASIFIIKLGEAWSAILRRAPRESCKFQLLKNLLRNWLGLAACAWRAQRLQRGCLPELGIRLIELSGGRGIHNSSTDWLLRVVLIAKMWCFWFDPEAHKKLSMFLPE